MAFRKHIALGGSSDVTVLVRRPTEALTNETIVLVDDYFSPPKQLLTRANTVMNFVGMVRGGGSPQRLQDVNVDGPVRLAIAARTVGVQSFCHLSSFSVYGEAETIGRRTAEAATSRYGLSKQAADAALLGCQSPQFRVTLVRVPTLYGPFAGRKLRQLAAAMDRLGWFPITRPPAPRSILHLNNLAVFLSEALSQQLSGVQFAADPQNFTVAMLADVLWHKRRRRVRLVEVPDVVLLPLRLVSKGTYNSIFRQSLVLPEDCIRIDPAALVPTHEGLLDVVPE